MTWQQSLQTVFSKYAVLSGRASRSEFWWFALFNFCVGVVLSFLGMVTKLGIFQWINWVYSLVVLVPTIAVSFRRLHDIGKGGGWIFINFVPLIGWIWYIVLVATPSEPTPNRFGPVPADV